MHALDMHSHAHMHICVHMCTHSTCSHAHTGQSHTHTCAHVCSHIHNTHMHTAHTSAYACSHVHTHAHVCSYMHTWRTLTHTHTHIHTPLFTQPPYSSFWIPLPNPGSGPPLLSPGLGQATLLTPSLLLGFFFSTFTTIVTNHVCDHFGNR